jgi:hypothetical protein
MGAYPVPCIRYHLGGGYTQSSYKDSSTCLRMLSAAPGLVSRADPYYLLARYAALLRLPADPHSVYQFLYMPQSRSDEPALSADELRNPLCHPAYDSRVP